jgi:hypothetical protein
MLAYLKSADDDRKHRKDYHCASCGVFITQSGTLFSINGSWEHSYTNPAGVRCNFMTFLSSENVLVSADLYEEHSWFPGYGWRFLLCAACQRHLGWQYDALGTDTSPNIFFGILTDSVTSEPASGH